MMNDSDAYVRYMQQRKKCTKSGNCEYHDGVGVYVCSYTIEGFGSINRGHCSYELCTMLERGKDLKESIKAKGVQGDAGK